MSNRKQRTAVFQNTMELLANDDNQKKAIANTKIYSLAEFGPTCRTSHTINSSTGRVDPAAPEDIVILSQSGPCYQDNNTCGNPSTKQGVTTTVHVWQGTTTTQACHRLRKSEKDDVYALVFASAKNPGGGVERGSNAQEESICRVSGLFGCLNAKQTFYNRARSNNNHCMYHHCGIYSPRVPVIKDDDGALLEKPYHVHFLTVPAVNATHAVQRVGRTRVESSMSERIAFSLNMAAATGARILVLGAFGCGVFGNDASFVADRFAFHLANEYRGIFDKIIFAVLSDESGRIFGNVPNLIEQYMN